MDWNLLLGQTASIATVITALVALYLYGRSKRDEVQQAARTIILEIRESERIVAELLKLKNTGKSYPDDFIRVIPFRGWEKYSHLFIKKLNNDEYNHINSWYKKCEVLEKYLEKNHNFFWVTTEERARQKEILGAKLAWDKPELAGDDFRTELESLCTRYFNDTAAYSPVGIKTQMDAALTSMTMVSLTPTWNKLKKIASYQDLLG